MTCGNEVSLAMMRGTSVWRRGVVEYGGVEASQPHTCGLRWPPLIGSRHGSMGWAPCGLRGETECGGEEVILMAMMSLGMKGRDGARV